jgi:hypothetical protein
VTFKPRQIDEMVRRALPLRDMELFEPEPFPELDVDE